MSGFFTINGQVVPNFITIEGADDMLNVAFDAALRPQSKNFYIGLLKRVVTKALSSNLTVDLDKFSTMSDIDSDNDEYTDYTGDRKLWVPGELFTGESPNGYLDNVASPATFNFTNPAISEASNYAYLGGCFLTDVADKTDYTGKLYAVGYYNFGHCNQEELEVTYTTRLVL
jgi:hypothetical protein